MCPSDQSTFCFDRSRGILTLPQSVHDHLGGLPLQTVLGLALEQLFLSFMGRRDLRNRSSAGRGSRAASTLHGYSGCSLVTQVEPSCPGHTCIGFMRGAVGFEYPATASNSGPTNVNEELPDDDSDTHFCGKR